MRLTVLGDNLTARHFVKYLAKSHESVQISLWTLDSVAYEEYDCVASCLRYYGMKNLPNSLLGADVVVNLHECTDFSLVPDLAKLQLHNVEVVRSILFHINSPLIHLSTPLLQCSNRWPNVYEPERDPVYYSSQWPFPEYCASKFEAEKLIEQSTNDCYIVRSVPTYGEGDECSILTDLIYFSNDKKVFSLGDEDGHMQMAYAGNVAIALWSAVCRLLSQSTTLDLNESFGAELSDLIDSADHSLRSYEYEEVAKKPTHPGLPSLFTIKEEEEIVDGCRARHNTVRTSFADDMDNMKRCEVEDSEVFDQDSTFEGMPLMEKSSMYEVNLSMSSDSYVEKEKTRVFEIFIINDDTPKSTIYGTYNQLLYNGKRSKSGYQYSFIPIYYIYLLFSVVARFAVQVFGPINLIKMLPNPSFLYFYFHHWTFFNSTKSVLLLGYKPDYAFKQCVEKSVQHYRELRKKDVRRFSWQNSITSSATAH